MEEDNKISDENISQYSPEEARKAIEKFLKELKDKNIAHDNDYGQLNDQPKKLIDCPHEIVFTVNANVLMQNEKGEHIGTEEICVKNYHIPVPIDQDYHIFMKSFFDHLQKAIGDSYKNSSTDTKDMENE